MLKNKILEKLLAIILIFTLTFSNFAFVTKSYASSFTEALFGEENDTGHKNVEFEAYFGTEENKTTSVISDVNNQELAISMKLNVLNSGYLKDAKIAIVEEEDGKGLNFELKEKEELDNYVQSVEDNIITMQQINNSKDSVELTVPIQYKNESFVNEENLSKDFLVVLTGVYIDEKGKENQIAKKTTLNVSWEDNREVKVENSVEKYIDYGDGVILQTILKVDDSTDKNKLPVKESEIIVDVPAFKDVYPSEVNIIANSTLATNGENVGEVTFNQDNWTYDRENNKLNIKVSNLKQLIEVNEYEDEFLQDGEKETIEESRYYNGSGVDEYLITYTYKGLEISEENISLNSNVEAKLSLLSGSKENNVNIITNNENHEYALNGKTGEIVSLNIDNQTKEVSKANIYMNYANDGKYETEFLSKTMINVSYSEIVEGIVVEDVENAYIDKQSNRYENNDIYYKQISLSKENFNNLLGENGEIKVSDIDGNVISVINNETPVDEQGNIVVNFENINSRLVFELTKPVAEGNLVISNVKAIRNSSLDKATFANIANVCTNSKIKVNYTYVEEIVDVGNVEVVTNLKDTKTKANLVISKDSFSTLESNTNVELRVELNNANDSSDIYGHSVFEIELPESIESVELTDASLLYAEGLTITSAIVNNKTIIVTLDGIQEGINSGVLTNGTNIVLNTNIKVNLYTPAKTETIKFRYSNSEATNYEDGGKAELPISYSAPTGLVAVNSISNYKGSNVVTSVKQGKKEDLIDIYSSAITPTMEIIVMNNNSNTVSNVSILGRIPFSGIKDIVNGNELGTTLDSKLVSGLVPDERNSTQFVVYYSDNKEATNNLDDASNNWVTNAENLDNIKSYLIVPVDPNYQMQETEILRFTYQFAIPENLPHNENFYGTFSVNYTNNSELAVTDEISVPDLVGLTTGEGPELSVNIKTDKEVVKEYEEIALNVTVKNVGENKAENINVQIPIPNNATYISHDVEREDVVSNIDNKVLNLSIAELEKAEEFTVKVLLKVSHIFEVNAESADIEFTANVTAKDLAKKMNAKSPKIKVIQADLEIEQYFECNYTKVQPFVNVPGDEISFIIKVSNVSDRQLNNLVVTEELPTGFSFIKASRENESEGGTSDANYDENTRIITWNINKLEQYKNTKLLLTVKVNELQENITISKMNTVVKAKADGTDTYESNNLLIDVAKPVLVISQTTDTKDTYVKEGDKISYKFTVRNEGKATAQNIVLTDIIPEGLLVEKVSYSIDGGQSFSQVGTDATIIRTNLQAGSELVANVEALVGTLDGVKEKSITNYAQLSSNTTGEIKSNEITHIVEQLPEIHLNDDVEDDGDDISQKANIAKTYKITGIAWLDSNSNGMRENEEELLPGIAVKLVDSENGVIQKAVTTDSLGSYTFSGVENGSYLVIFDYDTVKYSVTTYQRDGVDINVNSDVLTTKLEQEGKIRNGAITDVIKIENGSVSNIDIGLVLADAFDLKLDKAITKVTTQTAKGTTTDNYDNIKFAKTEIAAKYISGSTVYIEYTFTVSNLGDISGYVKKLVDYMPEGMSFNSSLEANSSWYTGSDGNLYSTALAEKELAPGESTSIKLVLTRKMTGENTGVINNLAEIYEDYNIYGVSDNNSTPANKAQGENDLGSADISILIKTGEIFINISIIITSILLGSIVIFITYNKIVLSKKKGGV